MSIRQSVTSPRGPAAIGPYSHAVWAGDLLYLSGQIGISPGTMTLGENSIMNGTGSQTGSNRWGDYSAISIDPTDDTTFWFVSQYVPTTSSIGWRLRIGS